MSRATALPVAAITTRTQKTVTTAPRRSTARPDGPRRTTSGLVAGEGITGHSLASLRLPVVMKEEVVGGWRPVVDVTQVGDFDLTWGESLRWDDRRQRLYFVDCAAQTLHWFEGGEPPLQTAADGRVFPPAWR